MAIIKQTEAARIAGVSRNAVWKMTQADPIPDFFVSHQGVLKIESDHPVWLEYVQKHKARTEAGATKIVKGYARQKQLRAKVSAKKRLEKLPKEVKKDVDRLEKLVPSAKGGGVEALAKTDPEAVKGMLKAAEDELEKRRGEAKGEIISDIEKKIADDIAKIEVTKHLPNAVILEYQELFKAQKLKEEVMFKQLQRRLKEKQLIEVEMGKFLFMGFIEQVRVELALIPSKQSPHLESYYKNNQSIKAQQLLKREFSGMLEKVVKAQQEALKKWQRSDD